jgi:hypothetical protein
VPSAHTVSPHSTELDRTHAPAITSTSHGLTHPAYQSRLPRGEAMSIE